MPLVPMSSLLSAASRGGYAVGSFECWNLESFCAVIEAAEEESSPLIAGFGGVGVDSAWLKSCGIEMLGAMGGKYAGLARVPVAFAFNGAVDSEQVELVVASGFNAVSIDTSNLTFNKNIEVTKKAAAAARAKGLEIEACLGKPEGAGGGHEKGAFAVSMAEKARKFTGETGIDVLAIEAGNLRFQSGGRMHIDLSVIEKVKGCAGVPLAIQGASGFPDSMAGRAIESGAVKFNFASVLKESFYEGLSQGIAEKRAQGPYLATGTRKPLDVLSKARLRLKGTVSKLMKLYGSSCRV